MFRMVEKFVHYLDLTQALFHAVVLHSEATVFVVTVSEFSWPFAVVSFAGNDLRVNSPLDAINLFISHRCGCQGVIQFGIDFTLVEDVGIIVGEMDRRYCSAK